MAMRTNSALRGNVPTAFYAAFPGSLVMIFIRPVGRGLIKEDSAATEAGRRCLRRSDDVQNYFFGQSFLFRDGDIHQNLAFAHGAQTGFPRHAVFDL